MNQVVQVGRSFLGWRVLAAATIGLALGFSNVGIASFGLFIIPLTKEFGWGRGDISVAVLMMNYTLVIAAPFLGTFVDRYGVRRVLLPSIVMFACAIASLSMLSDSIAQFYLTYVLVTILGIGTIPATYTQVAVAWFDRKRGLAVGIAMAGVGVGTALIPPYVQYLIGVFGLRAGYLGLAALILLVCLPVIFFLLIETPADVGQLPDGLTAERHANDMKGATNVGFSFNDCRRQRTFWMMVGGFVLLGFSTSGVMHHLVPLLRDRGVSADLAAIGASTLGVALILGRIVCGLLLDRFHAPRVVIAFLMGPVAGLAMLALGSSGIWAFAAILLIGLGIGAELDFMSYLVSRYLGQLAYGRAYGWMYAAFALGSGIGPVLMGYIYEARGSYVIALWILFVATALAILPFSRLGAYPALPVSRE